jgi:hypothetical protein
MKEQSKVPRARKKRWDKLNNPLTSYMLKTHMA